MFPIRVRHSKKLQIRVRSFRIRNRRLQLGFALQIHQRHISKSQAAYRVRTTHRWKNEFIRSSGSSAAESLATPGRVYLCYCGIRYPLVTSWTHENPGRRFFGCPNYKRNGCKFFKWFDPPMCTRSAEVILGIRYNWEVYEATNLSLRKESEDHSLKIDELENVIRSDQLKINDLVNETKMKELKIAVLEDEALTHETMIAELEVADRLKDVRIAELEDKLHYVEKNHYFGTSRIGFAIVVVLLALVIIYLV